MGWCIKSGRSLLPGIEPARVKIRGGCFINSFRYLSPLGGRATTDRKARGGAHRAHRCSSGSPAPERVKIRRARTTAGETHIVTLEFAGDRPPRYEKNATPHRRAVRKPVPRHRPRARPCKSGSPDPEPFVIRRAQTTAGETHIVTMEFAGDRPPRYDEKTPPPHRRARACPSPSFALGKNVSCSLQVRRT